MRCKYCNKKCVRNFNYCSDWCKEQKNTERKNKTDLKHPCLICGGICDRYDFNGKDYSMFKKYCPKCLRDIKNGKIKPKRKRKLRICSCCGTENYKGKICEMCKILERQRYKDYQNEIGLAGTCLNCGGDVIGYIHKKHKKLFCDNVCAGKYNYRIRLNRDMAKKLSTGLVGVC